jgi:hypothetical protein
MADLNSHFKSTCRILFGSEIGELDEYKGWLSEMVLQPAVAKSAISGKSVYLARPYYDKTARFMHLGEKETAAPLGINDTKDIDSVLAALAEKFSYCGNKNIGISMNVQESDSCTDCTDILCSGQMVGDKRVAYSYAIRESECAFGCMWSGEIAFSIRCQGLFFSKRCFDSYLCVKSSDLFSCMNCRASSDLMFCFNQVSKRHMIGNCELTKEKYAALKKKLAGEIAEELRKNKRYPSLFQLVGERNG